MNKYWVVGTSTKKYIFEFIKLLNEGVSIGDIILFDNTDKTMPKILYNGAVVQTAKSTIVMRQRFDVWEGMGLIRKTVTGFKVCFDISDYKKILMYSKLFILEPSDSKKSQEFRYSMCINVLVEAGILNSTDIKNLGVRQARGEMTIDKIRKSISNYEQEVAKDNELIKEIRKRVLNA